jgi:uncharacterized membrane protein
MPHQAAFWLHHGLREVAHRSWSGVLSGHAMEQIFRTIAGYVATGVEAGAVLFIAVGAIEALYLCGSRLFSRGGGTTIHRKAIWVGFAVWLLLALEFELASDVVRTAIAPSWNEVGQLGVIAAIRTVLNYFLERDIDKYAEATS